MTRSKARLLLLVVVFLLGFGVAFSGPTPSTPAWAGLPRDKAERVVFLGGDLAEEDLIAFTTNLAASGHPGVVLLDMPKFSAYTKAFLAAFQPEHVVAVGSFPAGPTDLEKRLGIHPTTVAWSHNLPAQLGKALFPRAERIVVCPAEPRRLLLEAAALAGTLQAPLYVQHGKKDEETELRRWAADWQTQELYLIGTAHAHVPNVRMIRLVDEETVQASCLKHSLARGLVQTLVIANPADTRKGMGQMSCLAPWLAVQRRAVLLLTNDEGDNTPALVTTALKHPKLHGVDALLLAADLRAIPMEHRPNPIAGKDSFIEMEPLTPTGADPFTFATGRLFHAEPGVVLQMLAGQRLLHADGPRKALVVSNPGGGLPLLELFSRYTTKELGNRGYQTTAMFGDDVTKEAVHKRLAENDIFLWEGHHSTMVKDYEMPAWTEPLPPAFVFLQSCLALVEREAQPFLERGAISVVGSSTRIYSATGGSFSLAYFDALLYDGQSLGGALRQAKNFLLAYTLLKEKRLGKEVKMGGANLRAAWAFTLWGDPSLHLPAPPVTNSQAEVRHELHGHTLTLKLPDTAYEKTGSGNFQAEMRPNVRLAGLIRLINDDDHRLVPFVFAEVALPKVPPGQTPHLRTKLPDSHWVWCWDARRHCGYLLVTPRPRDQRELHFHIDWQAPAIEAQAAPKD